MKRNKLPYLFLLLLFFCGISHAQTVEKLKFKKDPSAIYFFQKGKKSDTLHRSCDNLFYLVVPDTLKKSLSVEIENGQLLTTDNDSLLRFNYLPGFKYELLYAEKQENTGKRKSKNTYELKTLIDGISIFPEKQVSISLINKSTGGLLLENKFIYAK